MGSSTSPTTRRGCCRMRRQVTAAAGFGEPIDSRRYGPVPLDGLVGRVWFRYGPLRPDRPARRRGAGRADPLTGEASPQ